MYFVRDLDSKNGTHINDQKLTDEELLREGDVIKIGTTELIIEPGIALKSTDDSRSVSPSTTTKICCQIPWSFASMI